MVQTPDTLQVLLPGAPEPVLRRARNVVQFLRLLVADARPSRAMSVGIGIEQARSELESQDGARLGRAIRELLQHHLAALASADTFLAWGEPGPGHAEAWRTLDAFREEHSWLADLPSPRDLPEHTAARLLESAGRLGIPADEVALWRARILRFTEGPRAAEALLRSRLESDSDDRSAADRGRDAADRGRDAPGRGTRGDAEAELGACLVECLLDRGAPREARAWLQDHSECTAADPRLRQLLSWTLLCFGDYAGAKSAVVGTPVYSGILPASLAELRSERPEWLPSLAGRSIPGGTGTPGPERRSVPRERNDVGAAVLAVFAVGAAGQTIPVHVDAAPGLRSALASWLADRDGAYVVPGESEHELVIAARPVTVRKEPGHPIPSALGRETTLALALAPILDEHGEVAGWLHLECEHHRLPSRERLAAMAAAWRSEVLFRVSRAERDPRPAVESQEAGRAQLVPAFAPHCAAVFEDLVAYLGMKTAQRKWWGFVPDGTELRLVAQGGEGNGLSTTIRGKGRAVTRAAATRSRVSFDGPDARLSLDEKAASGVVLPLEAGGALCGLLAIESSRRRDFREADLARIGRMAEARGCALRIARFVAWHRRRFGFEVWFDAGRPGFRAFASRLYAAATSRSPVVFVGPGGSGKTILARWLHFESQRSDGPLRFTDCDSIGDREDLRRRLDASREGSLVLEGLERLPSGCQEELLRTIEGEEDPDREDDANVRILATTRIAAFDGSAMRIREDLARRLDRVQIRLSALRERRGDVLTLVAGFAKRFAEEEGVRPPTFSDETLALLWRQPWEGNARELENFVYKLVVFGPGRKRGAAEVVEPVHVHELAAQFSLQLARRLPSRHPSRADLLSALRTTRMPGGRLNKTRAALYLGWDPDTLVARMQDAGIGEDLAEASDEEGWSIASDRGIEEDEESSSEVRLDVLPVADAAEDRTERSSHAQPGARGDPGSRAQPRPRQGEGPGALHDAHGP